jgi:hypothetical protein
MTISFQQGDLKLINESDQSALAPWLHLAVFLESLVIVVSHRPDANEIFRRGWPRVLLRFASGMRQWPDSADSPKRRAGSLTPSVAYELMCRRQKRPPGMRPRHRDCR